MSAHNIPLHLSSANFGIADPGNAGAIPVDRYGTVDLVSAGAETRTIAAPTKADIRLKLVGKTVAGTITITVTNYTEAGDDTISVTEEGQMFILESQRVSATAFGWRLVASDPREAETITTLNATTVHAVAVTGTTSILAGEDGTAGAVTVFPATSEKGTLRITCTDQTGDTEVSLVAGAMSTDRTITLRDPGAAASILTTTDGTAAATTSTAVELTKLDDSVISATMAQGAGVNGAETGYSAGYFRNGSMVITRIFINLDDLVGSATDLDIIGESAAASCTWGQITAALNGTIVGGTVQCLEVPAGGTDDIDFYSSNVSTGTQDVIITDAAIGTETALVTSGGAWTAGLTKVLTGFPAANDYIYVTNGAAAGGTFSAGKFLITLYGFI